MSKCQRPVIAMASLNGNDEKPVCKLHLKKAKAFAKIFGNVELTVKEVNGEKLSCCEED